MKIDGCHGAGRGLLGAVFLICGAASAHAGAPGVALDRLEHARPVSEILAEMRGAAPGAPSFAAGPLEQDIEVRLFRAECRYAARLLEARMRYDDLAVRLFRDVIETDGAFRDDREVLRPLVGRMRQVRGELAARGVSPAAIARHQGMPAEADVRLLHAYERQVFTVAPSVAWPLRFIEAFRGKYEEFAELSWECLIPEQKAAEELRSLVRQRGAGARSAWGFQALFDRALAPTPPR